MIEIKVTNLNEVKRALLAYPKQAKKAVSKALDDTALAIKEDVQQEMRRVFKNPVDYTINSVKHRTTQKGNMLAEVFIASTVRRQSYLVPQVEGGPRPLKEFERGIGLGELVPAVGNAGGGRKGNLSIGQLRQIMSVLGRAETSAGYMANATDRSRKRNAKERDYVIIDRRQRGNLPMGVYQRFVTDNMPDNRARRRAVAIRRRLGLKVSYDYADKSKAWQLGYRRAIIRARGLRPVLLLGRTGHSVRPLLDFYGVARKTLAREFEPRFRANLTAYIKD